MLWCRLSSFELSLCNKYPVRQITDVSVFINLTGAKYFFLALFFAYTYFFSDFSDVIEYVFKEEWFNIDSTQLYNQIRDGMVTIQY